MAVHTDKPAVPRRNFLAQAAAASGVALAGLAQAADPATTPLPSIQLGPHRVSRLIAGWNPIGGHSHSTLDMARAMREYFTVEKVVEFLQRCEQNGITAWQFDHTDKAVQALRLVRQKGSALKLICLHAERAFDAPIDKVIADTAPIAIVHHGGVTDAKFRAGKHQEVHDFVKKVKDRGLLAGVSTHCPDHAKRVADEDWENDFFMCCFYYVNRPEEEQRRLLGRVTVGEPFFDSDPLEMTQVMRQIRKPCLGFKILAAGRACWTRQSTEQAFKFGFANIKPIDGVIVGMFPRYADQIAENAEYTRRHGAVG